jgi:hypothetical protein
MRQDHRAAAAAGLALARFPRTRRGRPEELRLSVERWRGFVHLDLRAYRQDVGGAWRPTARGVTVRPEDLDAVVAALERARPFLAPSTPTREAG